MPQSECIFELHALGQMSPQPLMLSPVARRLRLLAAGEPGLSVTELLSQLNQEFPGAGFVIAAVFDLVAHHHLTLAGVTADGLPPAIANGVASLVLATITQHGAEDTPVARCAAEVCVIGIATATARASLRASAERLADVRAEFGAMAGHGTGLAFTFDVLDQLASWE